MLMFYELKSPTHDSILNLNIFPQFDELLSLTSLVTILRQI